MEDRKIKCTNIVIISDCMMHDTPTVHAFVSRLISYVKEELPGHNKLKYFSDGTASQYKHFSNVCHHKSDYRLATEWHFFATSYGKSPCDGLGGSTKRLTA